MDERNHMFRRQRTSESSSSSSDSGIKLSPDRVYSSQGTCHYSTESEAVKHYIFHYSLKAEPMTLFISKVSLYPKQTNKKYISAIIHFPMFNNKGKSQTYYKSAICFVPHQKHKPKITSKTMVNKFETKQTFRSNVRFLQKG